MSVSPALRALREATGAAHERLEGNLRLALPGAGRHAYTLHVASLWGWLQPVEPALWSGAWPDGADVPARSVKSRWLEEDLAHARGEGYLRGEPAVNERPVAFGSLAERMGYAYVIEGSTLGGQVLRRRVGPALHPWPARYLEGYGEQAAQRWRDFLALLGAHVDTPDRIDEAARSAMRAFESLEEWFRRQGAA